MAIKMVENHEAALDLGAGDLYDAEYLLKSGFKKVVAVDKRMPRDGDLNRKQISGVEFVNVEIEKYGFPDSEFDLIISFWALHLLSKRDVSICLSRVLNSLKIGGVFACNLLGERTVDLLPEVVKYSKFEIPFLFERFSNYTVTEEEADMNYREGVLNHNHIFQIIARK